MVLQLKDGLRRDDRGGWQIVLQRHGARVSANPVAEAELIGPEGGNAQVRTEGAASSSLPPGPILTWGFPLGLDR
jgi:hypothetical protein